MWPVEAMPDMPESPATSRLLAGAMSGTSADGVDVAIVAVRGRGLSMRAKLLATAASVFEPHFRDDIQRLRSAGGGSFTSLCRVGRRLVEHYADAVRRACLHAHATPAELAGVAAHGQTLFHQPPDSIQWFDPALLAFQLGCVVISDFRRADLAAGGEGAPLVPFADLLLFGDSTRERVIVNLGGIANITLLPRGASIEQVRAFDTGPGNCVLDDLCRRFEPGGLGYDLGGAIAARGQVCDSLLRACMANAYFDRPPPRTTDGPAMMAIFEQATAECGVDLALPDLLATACEWTARTIVREVNRWASSQAELVVAGGGSANPLLLQRIVDLSEGRAVRVSDELGVPAQAREAMAFALLGAATLDGEPSNVPAATGARRRVVLGSITPRP